MWILLDNGHGIQTPGKRSPDGTLLEYKYTREIVDLIIEGLQNRGLQAVKLVPEDDDISLSQRVKRANELYKKYIGLLQDTIVRCVIATNQTYVEALKNKNAFDKEAQEHAFKMTYDAVMAILTDDAKVYLSNVFGDLEVYITKLIEAEVNVNKNPVAPPTE